MEYWKYHVVDEVELETIEETELKLIVGFWVNPNNIKLCTNGNWHHPTMKCQKNFITRKND